MKDKIVVSQSVTSSVIASETQHSRNTTPAAFKQINNVIEQVKVCVYDGCYMHTDAIRSILDERVASNLEMRLQSHQNAETKVSVPSRKSYKDFITFVQERAGHDRRYAIDANKLETQLDWRTDENFESGIIKTVEWDLGKYNV